MRGVSTAEDFHALRATTSPTVPTQLTLRHDERRSQASRDEKHPYPWAALQSESIKVS